MEKWINSLRYGDEQTKSYIIVVLGLFAATIVFGILCVLNLSWGFGLLSVVSGVIAAIILQNISFEDEEVLLKRKIANEHKEKQEQEQEEEQEKEKKGMYENYTKEKVEVLLYKYKVKEEHRKVMVDFCRPFRIKQCPAYIWKDRKNLYFLLLEEEPRRIEISLKSIDGIYYEKAAEVKSSSEYEEFKKHSFVGSVFFSYLPTYYEKVKNERRMYCKNLYTISPELKVTNTSARNLFDILEVDFILKDAVMTSDKFDAYFKMAYKSNILLRDRVITPEEYKDKIRILLMSISQSEMSERSYIELINQLEEYKLITEEYAKYYRKEGLVKHK